jgi:uncharacterized protein YkwD
MRATKIVPVVLVLTTTFAVLAADTPALARTTRQKILSKVNNIRRNHDIRRLDCTAAANDIAQAHSRQMARARTMFHTSNLYTRLRNRGLSVGTWGENVGYAPRWWRVIRLWMQSTGHRHNMLNRRFHRCGIGAASGGGRMWLTLILYG